MPTQESFVLLAVASVLLVLTPGPNLVYLLSRTLCQGRAAGVVSLLGTATGFVFHILAAALGLSAVFLAVPIAYDVLRLAGAGYLLWLAWVAVRAHGGLLAPRQLPVDPPGRLYRIGLLTSVLNPKIALFYVALFPQFVDPARGSVFVQSIVLGATQVAIVFAGDLVFVLAAARVARWLAGRPLWAAVQRWVMAAVLAAIALRLVTDDRR